MKENYGSIKSEIGIKLNDQSEFIEEMANMKAKLESVSSNFKMEFRLGYPRDLKSANRNYHSITVLTFSVITNTL